MKIGLLSTTIYPLKYPVEGYMGIEKIVSEKAVQLQKMGHEVTIFAPKNSKLPEGIKVIETVIGGINYQYSHEKEQMDLVMEYLRKNPVDILEDNSHQKFSYLHYNELKQLNIKLCSVLHCQCNFQNPPPGVPHMNLIGISNNHCAESSGILGIHLEMCYNGIDLNNYIYNENKGDYFLTLSRISRFKGIHESIQACKESGNKLLVAGEDIFVNDPSYVMSIMNSCDGKIIKYLGNITEEKKKELLSNAKALVLPLLWCLPPDEKIFTDNGLISIENIEIGNKILSKDGKYHKVKDINMKKYNGKIINIKCHNIKLPIRTTPEHNIYVHDGINIIKKQAKDITENDYLIIPTNYNENNIDFIELNKFLNDEYKVQLNERIYRYAYNPEAGLRRYGKGLPNKIDLDDSFLKFCGYFISDGHLSIDSVGFSINSNKIDVIENIQNIANRFGIHYKLNDKGSWTSIIIQSRILSKLFKEWFGNNAHIKKIPQFLFNLPKDKIKYLLKGLIQCDGCHSTNGILYSHETYSYSTCSQTLAQQIMLILLRNNINCDLNEETWKGFGVETQGYYIKIVYDADKLAKYIEDNSYIETRNNKFDRRYTKFIDGYYCCKVFKIENEYLDDFVYDITVEDEHNYMTNFIVSNSEPFGIVALEALASGTPVITSPRGAMMEIITHKKDGYFCYNIGELKSAMKLINDGEIKSKDCREKAEKFSIEKMTQDYLKLYERIVYGNGEW